MDRGTWWATVHGVTKELDTTERTHAHTHTHTHTHSLIIPLGTQSLCDGEEKNVGTTLAFDFLYLEEYV